MQIRCQSKCDVTKSTSSKVHIELIPSKNFNNQTACMENDWFISHIYMLDSIADDEMQVISHVVSRANLNFKSDLYHIQSVQTGIRRRKKKSLGLRNMIYDIWYWVTAMVEYGIFGWLKLFDFFVSFTFIEPLNPNNNKDDNVVRTSRIWVKITGESCEWSN